MAVDSKYIALHNSLLTALRMHGGELTSSEMLAVVSQMCGHVLALQVDKHTALTIFRKNVELGNQHAIEESLKIIMKDRPNG